MRVEELFKSEICDNIIKFRPYSRNEISLERKVEDIYLRNGKYFT